MAYVGVSRESLWWYTSTRNPLQQKKLEMSGGFVVGEWLALALALALATRKVMAGLR